MRKVWICGLCAALFLAFSIGLVRSAPSVGSVLQVRSLTARLMNAPRFFGPSEATVRRGAKVRVKQIKGAWYLVSYGSQEGWIHKNRVTSKTIALKSGSTGGGTARGEAELAGRGFNPGVEAQFRSTNQNLDFSHVDRIEKAALDPAAVTSFVTAGGLTPPRGGGK